MITITINKDAYNNTICTITNTNTYTKKERIVAHYNTDIIYNRIKEELISNH